MEGMGQADRPPGRGVVFAETVSKAIKAGLGDRLEHREAVATE